VLVILQLESDGLTITAKMSDTEGDTTMLDDEGGMQENEQMYGSGPLAQQELNEKYPNRPINRGKTLPFSALYLNLFNPLQDNKKKPSGPAQNRRKQGPSVKGTNETRRDIIERFISRWRKDVGDDFYPALRLIIPEKDRDRGMYGLKEAMIGKLLVKIMRISKDSDDAYNIIHWKNPGRMSSAALAGDFAGRCHEVISKRPTRTTPGDMTIAEVNEHLDRLSVCSKEEDQQPIFEKFYERMNAEELMWLIRMILRQMKIGATEKTILDLWHPDAENLFNISSSLRRVCWELHDPEVRLDGDDRGISLMSCFQPQLAAFQMRSMEQMVKKMKPDGDDKTFWIEEKLDGERMQLHMRPNDDIAGGFEFKFWSRKAKDYTYLYGEGLEDTTGALTKHMKDAFQPGVQSIILDGEMITWDMEQDKIFPFGHLKTAALAEQKTQYAFDGGNRPLFRMFDCLYLNGKDLTNHTLRIRREALEKAVKPVRRRFEVHAYAEATEASEIEPRLREVVSEKSEGLVLKNPRSAYRLNDRNDDWIKVKPEYMTEFGEALDCVVIGGYYGSGKRGQGNLSSFLCGLRVDQTQIDQGQNPQRCYSFFKVGGGFNAADYAEVRHRTDGKWRDWDKNNPPTDFIAIGGGERYQYEAPDVWIYPEDSFVVEVKAASVHTTDQFAYGRTLRFPRFKKIRSDKTWQQALSMLEFGALKQDVEEERKEKQFKVESARKQRTTRKKKRSLVIQGQEDAGRTTTPFAAAPTQVFTNMTFNVMTDSLKPLKKSKAEIEAFVKANGGTVVASEAAEGTICIADRNLVKVASLVKQGGKSIRRPGWLWDQVAQSEKDRSLGYFEPNDGVLQLPVEMDRHAYFAREGDEAVWFANVDEYGDSYSRDLGTEELGKLLASMSDEIGSRAKAEKALGEMIGHGHEKLGRGFMFHDLKAYFEGEHAGIQRTFLFAGGAVVGSLNDSEITHVIVEKGSGKAEDIRRECAKRSKMSRLVTPAWIEACWKEDGWVDEEAFAP
jgi:DNA ligase-4